MTGKRCHSLRSYFFLYLLGLTVTSACTPPVEPETPETPIEEPASPEGSSDVEAESRAQAAPPAKRKGISAARPKKAMPEKAEQPEKEVVAEVERPVMNTRAMQAYEAGLKAFDSADLRGATTQLKKSIQSDANAYEAFAALAMVQARVGDTSAALISYQRSLKIVEDYGPALRGYSLLLSRESDSSSALAYVADVAARHQDSPEVLAAHAEMLSQVGRSQEAQVLARSSLKLDPKFTPAMLVLARDHFRNRRIDLALYTLKGVLDGQGVDTPPRDPGNAEGHYLRGVIYLRLGEMAAGLSELKKAATARPDLVQAHLVLAGEMMSVGNVEEAMTHLRLAVAFENTNIKARQLLGDAYRSLGKPEFARKEFEWVIQASPQAIGVHYNLALLFLTAKKLKGLDRMAALKLAISHLELYLERVPRGGAGDAQELLESANLEKVGLEFEAADAAQAAAGSDDFSDENFDE